MQKLIFLVGLPGCGKSTYANENLVIDCEIFSSDKIRFELFGDENNQSDNNLVFSTLFERARDALKNGKNVVIDATNVDINERAQALKHFIDFEVYRIAIVLDVPVEICIERDQQRKRIVGANVIKKFATRFVMPTKAEGFDEVIIIK
jgi:predicted kinase